MSTTDEFSFIDYCIREREKERERENYLRDLTKSSSRLHKYLLCCNVSVCVRARARMSTCICPVLALTYYTSLLSSVCH